jgi:hypothetical protein
VVINRKENVSNTLTVIYILAEDLDIETALI